MALAMAWFVRASTDECVRDARSWIRVSSDADCALTSLLVVLQGRSEQTMDNERVVCDLQRDMASTISYKDERGGRSHGVACPSPFFTLKQVDDETGEHRTLWLRPVDEAGRVATAATAHMLDAEEMCATGLSEHPETVIPVIPWRA